MNTVFDTICDLKWNYPIFNISRGEFRNCCRTPPNVINEESILNYDINAFHNSESQRISRLELLKGIKTSDCSSCWKLENSNMISPRHNSKQFWNHLKNSNIINKDESYSDEKFIEYISSINDINHPVLFANNPTQLEINLGNTCDMKCMYCNHHYSSQWGTELIKYKEITEEQLKKEFPIAPSNFLSTFYKWFNDIGRYSCTRISIIGGEPLINPEFYNVIDFLVNSVAKLAKNKKPVLAIVTNMNASSKFIDKFISNLLKITEVFEISIYFSMESTKEKAEYIRNGLNWNTFDSNVNRLLTLKTELNLPINVAFMPTINVLSIVDTLNFVKYVENLSRKFVIPIGITQNIVSYPEWQSPMILTSNFSKYLYTCVEYMNSVNDLLVCPDKMATWQSFSNFLLKLAKSIENNMTNNSTIRKKFVNWFDTYDTRRNLQLIEIFPEYKNFYKLCKEL